MDLDMNEEQNMHAAVTAAKDDENMDVNADDAIALDESSIPKVDVDTLLQDMTAKLQARCRDLRMRSCAAFRESAHVRVPRGDEPAFAHARAFLYASPCTSLYHSCAGAGAAHASGSTPAHVPCTRLYYIHMSKGTTI